MKGVHKLLMEQFTWLAPAPQSLRFVTLALRMTEEYLLTFLRNDPCGQELAPQYYLAPLQLKKALVRDPYITRSLEILWEHQQGLFGEMNSGSDLQRHYLQWKIGCRLSTKSALPAGLEYEHIPLAYGLQLITGNTQHKDNSRLQPYPTSEAEAIADKINKALQQIARISPSCLTFITDFLAVIEVHKKDSNHVDANRHPVFGLLVTENIHLRTDCPVQMIELLIKAASFHYLKSLSLEHQLISPEDPHDLLDLENTVCPWTGDVISLRAYSYAVPIWFGIHNFFVEALKRTEARDCDSIFQQGYHRSLLGFLTQKCFLDRLGRLSDLLDPSLRTFISSSHEFVCKRL
jgi:hypothetical protein